MAPPDVDADRTGGAVGRRRARWSLLAGASLVSMALAAYEIVPASVTPLVRASLGVSDAAAGLLVGVMFGTAAVASLPTNSPAAASLTPSEVLTIGVTLAGTIS